MITYDELKTNPKEFLSATGITVAEFERLLPAFGSAYQARYQADKTVVGLPRMEDKLLFILVYQKTYPLQTMLGLHFGLSQPQANAWIHRLTPILQEALAALKMKPAREAKALAEDEAMPTLPADWLIDGSERPQQRSQDKTKRDEQYSGKKKAHTDKNLLLINAQSKQVLYLGPTAPGKRHDKKLADQEGIAYPPGTTLGKDSGFQGYEPPGIVTHQPKKA